MTASTHTAGPVLSVSVIMFTSPDSLVRCLEALRSQRNAPSMEVMVPHDEQLQDVASLEARFPEVRFLAMDGRRTPAELRALAVSRSAGRIVALLEDHCAPDPDWAARIVAAHEQPRAAIGGSVEKGFAEGRGTDTTLNWAVYLTDYSRYMNPLPAGPAHSLTDCNVTYKRDALEAIRESWCEEFHENLVNGLLEERGETLWLDPSIIVREHRPLVVGSAVRDRYAFGRLFASTRVEGAPLGRRMVYAAAAGIMPPVLVARAARNLMTRRRHRGQILRCLPALFLVSGVWMWGELVGYVTGSPGALRAGGRSAPARDAVRDVA